MSQRVGNRSGGGVGGEAVVGEGEEDNKGASKGRRG